MWRILTKEWWLGEVSIEVPEVQELEEEISNLKVRIEGLEVQIKTKDDEILRDATRLYDYRRKEEEVKKEIAILENQVRKRELVIEKLETDLKRVKIELRRRRKGDTNNQGLLKIKDDKTRILQIKTRQLQEITKEKDKELEKKKEELAEKSKKLIVAFEKIDELKAKISGEDEEIEKHRKTEEPEKEPEKAKEPKGKTDQSEKIAEPVDREEQTPTKTGTGMGLASLVLLLILAPILIMKPDPLPTTYNRTPDRIETETSIEIEDNIKINTETDINIETGIETETITEAEVSIETDTEADIETEAITKTEASTEIKTESSVVCIDPGHEAIGRNTGTQGIVTDVPEYKVNLEIALELKKVLKDQGMEVVMTREWNEVYIPNQARVQMANKAQADLFLLVHCNGSKDPMENGSYVFYPPANKRTEAILERSKEAARLILDELSKINRNGLGKLSAVYENMDKRVCCGSSYLILKHSEVPVVLVEVGYLTNPEEDRLLNSEDYQKKVATAISNGVIRYLLNNGWKITKTSSF